MKTSANQSNGKVLRRLFWTLFFRGRATSRKRGEEGTVNRHSMLGTLGFYLLVGFAPCLAINRVDTLTFSVMLHGATLFLVVMHLVATAGSVLFNREESEILLHRPVTAKELLHAKTSVLCGVTAIMALALNLPGMVAGLWLRDAHWWFPLAHLVSLGGMIGFCAGALVVVYQVCLRWFGRDRLDNIMTTFQTLLTVVLVMGSQSFRLLGEVNLEELRHAWWLLFLPPTWFGALDAVLAAHQSEMWMMIAAGVGVLATLLVGWLGMHRLAASYGEGLAMLNEQASPEMKSTGKAWWIRRMVGTLPLRQWLAHPVERSSFILTAAYMFRDRETKLRLYPGIAQVLALPLVFLLAGRAGRGGGVDVALAGIYMGWLPLMAMQMLAYSENWRAAELFQSSPEGRWQPLFHGARKAVLVLLAMPLIALLLTVVLATHGISKWLLLLLPNVVMLPVWSLVPGLINEWRPFATPYDAKDQARWGCLTMMVVMGVSSAVAMAGWGAMKMGMFPLALGGQVVVVGLIYLVLVRRIDGLSKQRDNQPEPDIR